MRDISGCSQFADSESPSREVWVCAQARISRVRAGQRVALRSGRGKSASGEGGGGFAVSCRDVCRCGHRQGGRAGGPGRTRRLAAKPPTARGAGERTGLAGPGRAGGHGRSAGFAIGPRTGTAALQFGPHHRGCRTKRARPDRLVLVSPRRHDPPSALVPGFPGNPPGGTGSSEVPRGTRGGIAMACCTWNARRWCGALASGPCR